MEFGHRLLGRIAGLLFVVPLLYFLCRRAIPRTHIPTYLGIGLLFALQGLVGWLMVKSGLKRPTSSKSPALDLAPLLRPSPFGRLPLAGPRLPVVCIRSPASAPHRAPPLRLAICRHLPPDRRRWPSRRTQGRAPVRHLPQNVRRLGPGRLVVHAAATRKPARQPHYRPLPTPLLRLCGPRVDISSLGRRPPHGPENQGQSNPLLGSGTDRLGDRHSRRACALGFGLAASGSSRGSVRRRAFPLPPGVQRLDRLIAVDDLGFDRAIDRNSAHCKRDSMLGV